MAILNEISEFVQKGRMPKVKELVNQALAENIEPKAILEEGLLSGMSVIGEKFKAAPHNYKKKSRHQPVSAKSVENP